MPKGWTTDIDYDFNWSTSESDGQVIANELGLPSPQPILGTERPSGELLYLFQSDTKYYLWNQIEQGVYEIVQPNSLKDIVSAMAIPKGLASVEVKEVLIYG